MKNRNSNRIHPLQKFLFKPKDVAKEPNVQNKVQRPLSVKSVNDTCSSRDRAVCGVVDGGVATLSLSSSSKGAGPLSPSPSSWPGEPAAGGRQRSCSRMTTDKVVTPLQPSQRDHLDGNGGFPIVDKKQAGHWRSIQLYSVRCLYTLTTI